MADETEDTPPTDEPETLPLPMPAPDDDPHHVDDPEAEDGEDDAAPAEA